MMIKNPSAGWLNATVLLLGIIGCGILSIYFGKELQWDLAGYHFYNPYAFLNQRINIDYWPPSAIQMFFSPFLDLLSYYLIQHFSPMMVEFILGSLHGINIALLFYLARYFLHQIIKNSTLVTLLAICSCLLGMYAPTVLPGIGGFFNDNLITIFVLAGIWLFVTSTQATNRMWAGCLLGIAAGFKLTAGIYLVGMLGAMVLTAYRWRDLSWIIVGISVGMLLSNGYWMWQLWQHYHNPFFPFFNKIFQSTYFPANNWHDQRFMPKNFLQAILFPFYFSTWRVAITELYCVDYRFVFVYLLSAITLLKLSYEKITKLFNSHYQLTVIPTDIKWLFWFCLISYIAWEINFSNLRYLGLLQMLAPLLIILLIWVITSSLYLRLLLVTGIFLYIFFTMRPMVMERTPEFGNNYFNVQLPATIKNISQATVLMAYSEFAFHDKPTPNQYLIPFFPAMWRFSGIAISAANYKIPVGLDKFLSHPIGPTFLLASADFIPLMYQAAQQLGYHTNGDCLTITSDRQALSKENILLCPVKR